MATFKLIVFCYLPGELEAVPAGLFLHDDQAGVGTFRYGYRYLERENAVAVDCAALPLGRAVPPVELNGGLYGAFRDASPDYWGRLVIASRMRCPIESVSEIEYLTHTNATRVGNLDFRSAPDDPEPGLSPPQFQDLRKLLEASDALERGDVVDERVRMMLEQGSSLGGARPKCTVERAGELWLAKFPSRNDSISIPKVEYATMKLARVCGLNVTDIDLVSVGDRDVFLIRRFDRVSTTGGWMRHGFLSALSLAQWDERDRTRWSYRALAERIRRYSVHVEADLRELFMRVAFNMFVRNADDHPRNHGFLAVGEGVALSPLFDVVPSMAKRGVGTEFSLAMGIGSSGRIANLENLLSVAGSFNMSAAEGREVTEALQNKVGRLWRDIFTEAGFSSEEIDILDPSFCNIRSL